jgi:hypothetical protein
MNAKRLTITIPEDGLQDTLGAFQHGASEEPMACAQKLNLLAKSHGGRSPPSTRTALPVAPSPQALTNGCGVSQRRSLS